MIGLLGPDAPVSAGIVADLYNWFFSRRVTDGVLQGLPRGGAPHQARFTAIVGIADEVIRVVALKDRAGQLAVVVGLVVSGKLAGVLHPHANLRPGKLAGDGEKLAVCNEQIVLYAVGDGAVGGARTSRSIAGNHRLAG